MNIDERYMRRAIELAKLGRGRVNPNPLVGAVVVKEDRIIGEGYHEFYGGFHAERNALNSCSENTSGATIYVNLEPCCHFGKTPPCVDIILEKNIKRVVIGSKDPNSLVSGRGIEVLRRNGVEVVENFLEDECKELNKIFFHYIKTKTPYVIMKYAMSMDGKIATYTGKSKWISSTESRNEVHKLRRDLSGIMVGVGTVLADNPSLDVRLGEEKIGDFGEVSSEENPTRIICDSNLRTPLNSKIVTTSDKIRTIIATCSRDEKKKIEYENRGCEVISQDGERVDLKDLMIELGKKGVDSILLEGGGSLNFSAVNSNIVQEVITFISPKIIGGSEAKTPVEGRGFSEIINCLGLKIEEVRNIGGDIVVRSRVD